MTAQSWEPTGSARDAVATDPTLEIEATARRELGRAFELDRVLARTASSIVFGAREREGDRPVALRVLRRPRIDTGLDGRLKEVVLASALDHPHVVPVYRAGVTGGLVWYAAKPIAGRSLAALLAERCPLDRATCLHIAEQVGNALAYAHRRGVTHGDLRPANVLLEGDWALVTDFAIGRVLDRYGVRGAPAGGTPRAAYRAPEDAPAADPTEAGDQYALAATIWECLTGTPPIGGRPVSLAPDPAGPMAAALQRALHPRPALRYPSVLDLVAALDAPDVPPAPVAPPRNRPTSTGQRVLVVDPEPRVGRRFATAAIVAVVGVAGWLAFDMPGTRVRPAAPAAAPRAAPPLSAPDPVASSVAPQPSVLPPLPPIVREFPRPAPTRAAAAPVNRVSPGTSEAPGSLFISSMPWGQLFIDGQPAGTTPKSGFTLGPGPHRVEIVRPGYYPFRVEIHVAAGQEVRLVNIVLEALNP
jgi:serine/threonine-protein kinase